MNTSSYRAKAQVMPLEGAGRFFLPPSSTNLPLFGFSGRSAGRLVLRGLRPSIHNPTFHHLPPVVEGREKKSPQQSRGLQQWSIVDLPDIPHMQPVVSPHWFFENPYGRHLPS
ncbi:hypothetical protein OE470_06745 [Pseudomonas aeruginosa]|nr:hypothetical protein [Pseudomonas aeruginosa]MCU9088381.1 hypothetical protein [Pseudomonas aeruginosa]